MAKRYTATEIWSEDWFLCMPNEYKLFWYFMLSACDHGGLFRVNLKSFCTLNEVKISPAKALDFFNESKIRIRVINNSLWLIEDFFVYQYGQTFNENNRVHASILDLYKKNEIQLSSIRGLKEVKYGVKDKDKDIDKDKNIEKEQLEEGNNEEIKKEIVKEPPIKFSFITPNGKDIGMELSLSEKVNTIEFIDRMKKIKYSDLEIKNYWEAFKIQYFVGEKTYNSKIDIVSHFRNWLKDQKNGRQINSTSNKSNKPTTAELRNESLEKAFRL